MEKLSAQCKLVFDWHRKAKMPFQKVLGKPRRLERAQAGANLLQHLQILSDDSCDHPGNDENAFCVSGTSLQVRLRINWQNDE
jgi:hypothetical protein